MIIPIISRVDWPTDGFFPGSYDFEISPTNAQQIILNNATVKLKMTDNTEHLISNDIYAHYVALSIEPFDYVWYVVQNISTSKWYLGLIKDPGNCPWFVTYDSIFDIQEIIIDGTLPTIVTEPYSNDFAFTLDPLEYILNQSTSGTDTFFQITTFITVFKFQSSDTIDYVIPEKALPFNGLQKFSLGRTIHDLMDRFETVGPGAFQYHPVEVVVSVEEKLMADNTLIAAQQLPVRKFVAGYSRGLSDVGLLFYTGNLPARVTKNSFKYINMVLPAPGYELQIFRNGTLFNTISLGSLDDVCTFKLTFDQFTQGDVIEVKLELAGSSTSLGLPSRKFHVWPSGKKSNIIVWEDEFLLKQSIEFTGEYSMPNDFDNDLNSTYQLFKDVSEKVSDTVSSKLIINTGFVSPNDFPEIFSLSKSKRAWWLRNGEYIPMVTVPKNLPALNSQDQLVSYNLEFILNRKSNEETYS